MDARRRQFIAASGTLLLAGCASQPIGQVEKTAVPAPGWKPGDRWTYQRIDGFTKLDAGSPVTREVTADPSGVRVIMRTAAGGLVDDALFTSAGIEASGTLSGYGPLAGRFDPALRYYDFPLVSGKAWKQSFYRIDAQGFREFVSVTTTVEGWDAVDTPAGRFRAIAIRRDWNMGRLPQHLGLGLGNAYRWETEWYAPDVGSFVRWERREEYEPSPGVVIGRVPSDWFVYTLQSFSRA